MTETWRQTVDSRCRCWRNTHDEGFTSDRNVQNSDWTQ